MIVQASAMFEGLTTEGVEETISEYAFADTGWTVHTLAHNNNGYYLLLTR